MIRRVMATYGRLDYASNNAGIAASQVDAGGMKTADWPKAGFDWMIAVKLNSVCSDCDPSTRDQMCDEPFS